MRLEYGVAGFLPADFTHSPHILQQLKNTLHTMSSTKKVSLEFKGLMAPVFTSFNNDEKRTIRVDNIDGYAKFLKSEGIHGVLVNGTTGEGPVLNLVERKLVTEKWWEAAKKYDLTLMVQIGGAALPDVIELAIHAESLGVHAILCLPELYFKPKNVEALVEYFKLISKYCPNTPLLYYHIPMFVGLNFHMPTFCDLAEAAIPNFVGIKYTSNDLAVGSACLKKGRSIFLGADTLLVAGLVMGFDSAIMTTLNICPYLSVAIMEHMKKGELSKAQEAQKDLTLNIDKILQEGNGEWVPSMKQAFNKFNRYQPNGGHAGPVREFHCI
ncbi:N-acetylneuraminate lyase B-like isoform X2 [Episyrphus balteatus]|uniref:N-acetylneuraminate lyase B-like isoform X2 n=1 Tax=Episyrphus balteatus TaxID=286459 RepID=UPI0024855A44|nr:N-acetylneuraminate lyase B-like isoform X2 [Episyrphus balteatus]